MADSTPKVKTIKYSESGLSGTQILSGQIVGEEYNRDLSGIRGYKEYDRMRRNDTTVSELLWAVKYPIIGADWYLRPGSEDARDIEIRDTVHTNLFEIVKLRHAIEEALTCIDFGFSLFEMVFEPLDINGTLRIAMSKLAYRKQTSLWRWLTIDDKPGITQYTIEGNKSVDLEKLARFTLRQEGDNYEGQSMLRTAYKHWFYKEKFYKMEAVGYERQAVGVPFAKYPVGATEPDKKEVKKLLQNMRANQNAYMMTPLDWEAGFMDMGARGTKDSKPGIDHHDTQILKAFFAQFMALGSSQSGSRAVSADHSQFFMLGVNAVADLIAEVFNDTIIKTIVDLNYTTDVYPVLEHGKIGDENLPVSSDAVSKFVLAGALNPRPEDENVVRKMLDWPELSEEEIKQRKDDAEAAKANLPQAGVTPPAPDEPKPKGKGVKPGDKSGDLNASAVAAEARALTAKLDKVLYGHASAAA